MTGIQTWRFIALMLASLSLSPSTLTRESPPSVAGFSQPLGKNERLQGGEEQRVAVGTPGNQFT